jgi:hypothetical protein
MRALVPLKVDQFGGFAGAANRGFLNGLAVTGERDDAAVVIGIHLSVEQIDAGQLHGFDDGIDLGRIAALREVRYTFNQSGGHGKKNTIRGSIRQPAQGRRKHSFRAKNK